MLYNKFMYLYPPRPEHKTTSDTLDTYDNGEYIAMPKYNGSACMVFTNGIDLHVYNRHKQKLTNCSQHIDFKGLGPTKKWFCYAGEYLNKGKYGETDVKEKDKFVIWDILVWDGVYLIGETLTKRLELLETIHPCHRSVVTAEGLEQYKHLCCTRLNGIYKAPAYTGNFYALYNEIVQTDLYEGLVLKKLNSKLSPGYNSANNTEWQIKARKQTRNYNF